MYSLLLKNTRFMGPINNMAERTIEDVSLFLDFFNDILLPQVTVFIF